MAVKIEVPAEIAEFTFPAPLQRRLQSLLDRQDLKGKLTTTERQEAEALADLSELLAFLKLQVKSKNGRLGK